MNLQNVQVKHITRALVSEHSEQCVVIDYCKIRRYPVFAIPNGGSRNKAEAAKLKAEGVSAGVPDLFIPIPKQGYHGLFVEMKVGKNRTSHEQDEWLALLRKNGYKAAVCYGADAAIKTIDDYITG
jgi:hypothetical protein